LKTTADFIRAYSTFGSIWCLKRLRGTDTPATNARLAGPTLPRELLVELFPGAATDDPKRELTRVSALLPREGIERQVQVFIYRKLFFQKLREESRLAGWGGKEIPLMNPSRTGSLAAFAFHREGNADWRLAVWVCRTPAEESEIEAWAGPVEPGVPVVRRVPVTPAGPLPDPEKLLQGHPAQGSGNQPLDHVVLQRHASVLASVTQSGVAGLDSRSWANLLVGRILADALTASGQKVALNVIGNAVSLTIGRDQATIGVQSCVADDPAGDQTFTLQPGMDEQRMAQLAATGKKLVIPSQNLSEFPARYRPQLAMLNDWINSLA
jgi:hypothetical protein